MDTKNYTVGKRMTEWGYGNAQSITFIVTEDCNVLCIYEKRGEGRCILNQNRHFIM